VKRINSDALVEVNRALGLSGAAPGQTELVDDQIFQTLDIAAVARRGLTMASSEGIFHGILQNVHTDAESLNSEWRPYVDVQAPQIGAFPNPMPAGLDVWLLAMSAREESGAGTPTGAVTMVMDVSHLGFGVNDSGVPVSASTASTLARFDALVDEGGHTYFIRENGDPWWRGAVRFPRGPGTRIQWRTTSTLTATYDLQLVVGVFPTALGQDALT